mgnify:CR=1 FL=1
MAHYQTPEERIPFDIDVALENPEDIQKRREWHLLEFNVLTIVAVFLVMELSIT